MDNCWIYLLRKRIISKFYHARHMWHSFRLEIVFLSLIIINNTPINLISIILLDGESAQFIHSSSIYHQHRSPNNFTRALIFTQTEDHTFETLPLLGRRNSNSFHLQRYSRRYFDLNNSHFAFISNHLSTYSKRKAVDVPMHDHEGEPQLLSQQHGDHYRPGDSRDRSRLIGHQLQSCPPPLRK